jgi:acetyl-CoA acetyltransferase
MVEEVFILGIYSTPAGRFLERSPKDLVREAYLGALKDAGIDGRAIGYVWFSNMMLDFWGQPNVKGQVCLLPLLEDGLLPAGVATTNVEAACASGSLAFNGAWKDILSGQCDMSLAIGMEKMYDPARRAEFFVRLEKGTDFLDPQDWRELYERTATACGTRFEPVLNAPSPSISTRSGRRPIWPATAPRSARLHAPPPRTTPTPSRIHALNIAFPWM